MGDSKIGRNELAEFARQTAEYLEPFQRRQRALEVCFDVLVTSLGPEVEAKVKAELERRAAAMKTPVPPPPKIDPCECCGAPGDSGSMPYGIYCEPCGRDVTHPTGDGSCFVRDGRKHATRREGYCEPCGWCPPIDSGGIKTPGHLCTQPVKDETAQSNV